MRNHIPKPFPPKLVDCSQQIVMHGISLPSRKAPTPIIPTSPPSRYQVAEVGCDEYFSPVSNASSLISKSFGRRSTNLLDLSLSSSNDFPIRTSNLKRSPQNQIIPSRNNSVELRDTFFQQSHSAVLSHKIAQLTKYNAQLRQELQLAKSNNLETFSGLHAEIHTLRSHISQFERENDDLRFQISTMLVREKQLTKEKQDLIDSINSLSGKMVTEDRLRDILHGEIPNNLGAVERRQIAQESEKHTRAMQELMNGFNESVKELHNLIHQKRQQEEAFHNQKQRSPLSHYNDSHDYHSVKQQLMSTVEQLAEEKEEREKLKIKNANLELENERVERESAEIRKAFEARGDEVLDLRRQIEQLRQELSDKDLELRISNQSK